MDLANENASITQILEKCVNNTEAECTEDVKKSEEEEVQVEG